MTTKVMSYETGDELSGTPSDRLVRESARAGDTGAVAAYRDTYGVWQYVPEHEIDHYARQLGKEVVKVYVESQPTSSAGMTYQEACTLYERRGRYRVYGDDGRPQWRLGSVMLVATPDGRYNVADSRSAAAESSTIRWRDNNAWARGEQMGERIARLRGGAVDTSAGSCGLTFCPIGGTTSEHALLDGHAPETAERAR